MVAKMNVLYRQPETCGRALLHTFLDNADCHCELFPGRFNARVLDDSASALYVPFPA